MRILHTSDWHLGQNFMGKSRAEEHRKFCDWLLLQVQEQAIDALLIAGDVFDTGAPPSYARELYNHFIVELNQLGCQLVVLAGNHDSVAMLNESKTLLARLNTRVIAGVADDVQDQVIMLQGRDGQPGAVLCAVPYLRPRDLISSEAGQSGKQKARQLGQAISDFYQQTYEVAEKMAAVPTEATDQQPLPIVATGHLTAMGVQTSESVRDIYIGSLEAFPANHFPPVDYIALGHIHRPQKVAKSDTIRYCGSPIPLSFDELRSEKQVLIVDVAPGQDAAVTVLPVPLFQPMAQLSGDLNEIAMQLDALESSQELPVWLSIEVSAQSYLNDLQQRVQALTADYNVEVLQLRRSRVLKSEDAGSQQRETLAELSPQDVFEQRLAREDFSSDEEQARLQRLRINFAQVLSEVRDDLDADDEVLAAQLTRAAAAISQAAEAPVAAMEDLPATETAEDTDIPEVASDIGTDSGAGPEAGSDTGPECDIDADDGSETDTGAEQPLAADDTAESAVDDLFAGQPLPAEPLRSEVTPVAAKAKPETKSAAEGSSEKTADQAAMQQQSLIDGF